MSAQAPRTRLSDICPLPDICLPKNYHPEHLPHGLDYNSNLTLNPNP